ncbi:permease-like cell division protein FtsX [Algiphilus aromaticivorans]|uniref:permease-like cell division protein FtsX n=1 Tax=Algiphilus aromaticivorans TaxID=382454 RepID=UPI0005C15C95|nr:permease-like cell division protein FtsX [Algiphilus aromaticivorans]
MSRGSAPRPPAVRRWAAAHAQAAFDSLGRLWRRPLASLLSIAVLGITLALPAALHTLVANLQALGAGWEQGARMSLLLEADAGERRLDELAGELRDRGDIASVRALTAEEALAEFEAHSGLGEAAALLPENPLPATLIVVPEPAEVAALEALHVELGALEGVDEVVLDAQWLQRLAALLQLIEQGVLLFAGALAAAVLVIVGNTIGLEVAARREEIEVMKLIGAPEGFIRRPFLYSGLWYGLIGGLVALLMVGIALMSLDGAVAQLAGTYASDFRLQGPDGGAVLGVLGGGCLLGWLGALAAVTRQLRGIEAV